MPALSRDSIEAMAERQLRPLVLVPLLRAMGFNDVMEWHGGAGELGKDVVGWKLVEPNKRHHLVVVAKATALSSNNDLGDLATQVRQAFNTPFHDGPPGQSCFAHECWVITNKRLGKEAL